MLLKGSGKPGGTEIKWDASSVGHAEDVNLLGDNTDAMKQNHTNSDASKEVGVEANAERTKYKFRFRYQNKAKS
jgi:hypothetical protein